MKLLPLLLVATSLAACHQDPVPSPTGAVFSLSQQRFDTCVAMSPDTAHPTLVAWEYPGNVPGPEPFPWAIGGCLPGPGAAEGGTNGVAEWSWWCCGDPPGYGYAPGDQVYLH